MSTATITPTPGDPSSVTIRLEPHGIRLEVQVPRRSLAHALGASDSYWSLTAQVLAQIDAVENAALFKYARVQETSLTLSAAEIIPFTHAAGARLPPRVH